MPLSDGNASTQRALTIQLIQKKRLLAPAVWLREHGSDPSPADALADSLSTDIEGWNGDQNLGLRLVAGHLELGVKSADDVFAYAFFRAADHLKIDARFAFGVTRITSVILNVEDQELIEPWAPRWPKGYKDKNGHWTETTVKTSSTPTKIAKAIWRHSRPLPGSILSDGVVVWRPKGKAAALDYEMGVEELEPRALAATGMDTILRAIAYATLTYWVRIYLDGLTVWDSLLTRLIGAWIARVEVEGRSINAQGKSLEGVCWSPIDTREQALDLVDYLQTLGASGDLKVAYQQAEAALIRNPSAPVAGWGAIEGLFGAAAKQGIRRAMRAGIDLDVIERMAEQWVLDKSSSNYIDRYAIPKGVVREKSHEQLAREYDNEGVIIGRKRHNPFRLYATSSLRTDVFVSDMHPGEEPAAIIRYSPLHGILKDDDEWTPDEHKVLNTYPGFMIKPIGTVDPALMAKVIAMLDRMLGLLTRDNPLQMLWLKKFIAWIIQFPDKKQQVCPVIVGGQGIGKSFFGETLMSALFGSLAGTASAALLADNDFLITPFIGKLVTFIDEVRLETSGVINEIKKLVRQKRISGQVKFGHQREYYIPSRLILAANDAKIGLTSQDAADRALFFIMAWNAENKGMNDVEFLSWAWDQKPFYAEFTALLESVAARQHLMRHFHEIEVTQAELEDLTYSSRFDENVVRSTMSKAREIAREIAASARIVAGNDLTAWFNIHNLRGAIAREEGRHSRVEASAVMKEFETAGVIEVMSGGYHRFKWGYGKTLQLMGEAHKLVLHPHFPTGPGDFDANPVLSNGNPPPWRGNKRAAGEPYRPFNPSDDPDRMDDFPE